MPLTVQPETQNTCFSNFPCIWSGLGTSSGLWDIPGPAGQERRGSEKESAFLERENRWDSCCLFPSTLFFLSWMQNWWLDLQCRLVTMRKSSGEPQIHQHWHHWLREPRPAFTFLQSEKNKPVFARATLGLLFAGEYKSNWYTGTSFPTP